MHVNKIEKTSKFNNGILAVVTNFNDCLGDGYLSSLRT